MLRFVGLVHIDSAVRIDRLLPRVDGRRTIDGQSQVFPERIENAGDARSVAEDAAYGRRTRMPVEHAASCTRRRSIDPARGKDSQSTQPVQRAHTHRSHRRQALRFLLAYVQDARRYFSIVAFFM